MTAKTQDQLVVDVIKKREALSIALSVLDVRADQWVAAASGPAALEDCIDELYEADEDECVTMEVMIRNAAGDIRELLLGIDRTKEDNHD